MLRCSSSKGLEIRKSGDPRADSRSLLFSQSIANHHDVTFGSKISIEKACLKGLNRFGPRFWEEMG